MTTIEVGLKTFIEAQVPTAGRGYPHQVPGAGGAEFPAWSYFVVDDDQVVGHTGGTGFVQARIQIDLIADETDDETDYSAIMTIAAAMRAALDGYQGDMGGVTVDYCKTTLSDEWAEIHQLPVRRFDVLVNYKI